MISLKIKEQVKEYCHNTDCILENITDDNKYLMDLKGPIKESDLPFDNYRDYVGLSSPTAAVGPGYPVTIDETKLDGLKAIFSYDIVTSKLGGESAGNLEFMLSYDFNLFIEKENKIYKSVRFL